MPTYGQAQVYFSAASPTGPNGEESSGSLIKWGYLSLQAVSMRVDDVILKDCGFPGNQVSFYGRTLPVEGLGGHHDITDSRAYPVALDYPDTWTHVVLLHH